MNLAMIVCTGAVLVCSDMTNENHKMLTDGPDLQDCYGGNFLHATDCYRRVR